MDFYPCDTVWRVQGDLDNLLFKRKIDAEAYARLLFPDEAPSAKYARISFKEVQTLGETE